MSNVNEWAREFVGDRKVLGVSTGTATRSTNKVYTSKGYQHHRGYFGTVLVRFEGQRQPEYVKCCWHQKSGAARKHADVLSRALKRLV